jgi:iron(III) transport system substrate-binding protein
MRSLTAPLLLAIALACAGCGAGGPGGPALPPEESVEVPGSGEVVVFVETPRYLAGPLLKMFSDQTGITVHPVYREADPEGFFEKVRTEAAAGRADLFLGTGTLEVVSLARAGLAMPFRPAGARPVPSQYRDRDFRWTGYAVNPRVIVFNQDRIDRKEAPQSLDDLISGPWAGKAAVARPTGGPAAFQAAALISRWGDERGLGFYRKIAEAGNRLVETDGEVRRLVTAGEVPWGVVNLDQGICAKRQAEPITIFFPDRMGYGAVVVPEVVALLKDAPHLAQARGLYAYLFATEVAWAVGQNDCALMSLLPIAAMGIKKPDWVPLLGALNVLTLDNDAVYDTWMRHQSFLATLGAPPSGS